MRHINHLIITILLCSLSGCEKLDLKVEVPGCIEKKIKEFRDSKLTCDSDAQVLRFDFQGLQVYLFDPGNCSPDMSENVYDQNCNLICKLGGYGGNTMCNGEDFEDNASNSIIVWEN